MYLEVYPSPNTSGTLGLLSELDLVKFKYRAIFNGTKNYYIILDKGLNVVDFNRASYKFMYAVSGKRIIEGADIQRYLKEDMVVPVLSNCYSALQGETQSSECRIQLFKRRLTWWHIEYSPACDEAGNVAGVILHIESINKRKLDENRIALQSSKLRAISLMQSHDIRGPVCTIKGLLSLIKDDGENGSAGYLQLIEQTINLLDERIKGIVECAFEV